MREIALHAKNDLLEPTPLIYGSSPHEASTWDADMIYGCLGDNYGYVDTYHNITTYEGLYLDELQCPVSHNVRIDDKVYGVSNTIQNFSSSKEVQSMRCIASNGTFSLAFRGVQTTLIHSNFSLSEFRDTLLQTHVIGDVLVRATYGNRVCDATGGVILNITFLSELVNIPLLRVTHYNLTGTSAHVSLWRDQKGSGQVTECGSHGECNRKTGQCDCFPFWGSSDGFGGAGFRGDCGHNLVY